MFKLFTPIIACAALFLSIAPAEAQHRRHGYGGHYWNHHSHYYRSHRPYRHYRRNNIAPYVAGAIGAAIIGGIIYDQYGRRCFREVVGYDRFGDPITRRVCE
jgi:hypothetical protein